MNGDLISRSALVDWLSRATGFRVNCEDCPDIDCLGCIIENAVKTAPTVTAVEVVRCRDCAVPHNRWTGCPRMNGTIMPEDGYCSFGERRKD